MFISVNENELNIFKTEVNVIKKVVVLLEYLTNNKFHYSCFT